MKTIFCLIALVTFSGQSFAGLKDSERLEDGKEYVFEGNELYSELLENDGSFLSQSLLMSLDNIQVFRFCAAEDVSIKMVANHFQQLSVISGIAKKNSKCGGKKIPIHEFGSDLILGNLSSAR